VVIERYRSDAFRGLELDCKYELGCPFFTGRSPARALLGWSHEDLAAKSGTGAETLCGSDPKLGTVQKWRRALEAAGVQIIDDDETGGPGVRLRGGKVKR